MTSFKLPSPTLLAQRAQQLERNCVGDRFHGITLTPLAQQQLPATYRKHQSHSERVF